MQPADGLPADRPDTRLCLCRLLQQDQGSALGAGRWCRAGQGLGTHPTHEFSYRGKPITQVSTKISAGTICAIRGRSWHVQNGTTLFALREMGGWSSVEMVRRYAHLAADHLAPYAERLCALPPVAEDDDGTFKAQA